MQEPLADTNKKIDKLNKMVQNITKELEEMKMI